MGTLQARVLEWFAISSSRGIFPTRDRTGISYVSCIGRQVLYHQLHLGGKTVIFMLLKKKDWTSSTTTRVLLAHIPSDSNCKQMIPHGQSSTKHTWNSVTVSSLSCCSKVPKLGGLEQQKFIISQFWRLQFQNHGFSWTVSSMKAVRENPPGVSLSFWCLHQSLVFMCLQIFYISPGTRLSLPQVFT